MSLFSRGSWTWLASNFRDERRIAKQTQDEKIIVFCDQMILRFAQATANEFPNFDQDRFLENCEIRTKIKSDEELKDEILKQYECYADPQCLYIHRWTPRENV